MSRYTPKQYATALFEVLQEAKLAEQVEIVKRFAVIIVKNYDRAQMPKIAMQFKKLERVKAGRHEVMLTSARPLEKAIVNEIKAKVGVSSSIIEIIDPEVLGGLKVLIDDEIVVDGTYRARINKMVETVIRANT